mmetsp:Transcript_34191/g.45198  ORF Transcript_34191/g.45198 Transcript_34191/m.45198 type:complete len:447 (+) Transcript_34191:203-1543(+)
MDDEKNGSAMICFPFKQEDNDTVIKNMRAAAEHPAVGFVLMCAHSINDTYKAVEDALQIIQQQTKTPIHLAQQKPFGSGSNRRGKGDGMNTAVKYFVENTNFQRLHFYDADITSFTPDWVTKCEAAAVNSKADMVRFYFPRSSTDAQITWHITKIGFALLWPHSRLLQVNQPLGGELAMSRAAAALFLQDQRVQNQSDWGIDTLYTFASAQAGLSCYEVYAKDGKMHALYGALSDLKTMCIECFSAVQSLQNEQVENFPNGTYGYEEPEPAPVTITEKQGFCLESTLSLLKSDWTTRQEQLLYEHYEEKIVNGVLSAKEWPVYEFMDGDTWLSAYQMSLKNFVKGDADWESLFFRLWVLRVICYTVTCTTRGYDFSMRYLQSLVDDARKLGHKVAKQQHEINLMPTNPQRDGKRNEETTGEAQRPKKKLKQDGNIITNLSATISSH